MKATSEALSEVQDQVAFRRKLFASGQIKLVREEPNPAEDEVEPQPPQESKEQRK